MDENENPGEPGEEFGASHLPPMPVPAEELRQTMRGGTSSGLLVNLRLPLVNGFPPQQERWTIAIRLLLAIPQFIVLIFVGIGVFFVAIAAWLTALFTGRVPDNMAGFFQRFIRWSARVGAYFQLMVDVYPQFDGHSNDTYAIDVEFPELTELNRWAVLFRIIIAIPAYALEAFIGSGLYVFMFPFWICALILGRLPDPVYRAAATVLRFEVRVQAYILMVTPEYPWGWKGDSPDVAATEGSATQGTTRFNFVLVGAAQTWIWIWLVVGVIYEVLFRHR